MNAFGRSNRAISISICTTTVAALLLASGCCNKSQKTAAAGRNVEFSEIPTEGAPVASSSMQGQSWASGASAASSSTGVAAGSTLVDTNMLVIPLYEEKFNVGKQPVQTGSIRIRKIVRTETINEPVQVRREEVVVDRDDGTGHIQHQVIKAGENAQITIEVPGPEGTAASAAPAAPAAPETPEAPAAPAAPEAPAAQPPPPPPAAGAAEAPGGQAAGKAANNPENTTITDPASLTGAVDASALAGHQVQLSGVKVARRIGDQVMVLEAGDGQTISCVVDGGQKVACKPGDTVNVTGVVKPSKDQTGLQGSAAKELSSHPVYVEAQSVENLGK